MSCSLVQDNFLNDITLIKELGNGTYGSVYLARKPNGDKFAIKYMYNDNNGIIKSSLLDIDAILRLQNVPDVIKTIGICYLKDRVAFVLEAMDSDLFNFIKITPVQDRLQLSYKLLNTLINVTALMETLNITHFDIKPQNVLVSRNINTVEFKVTDFGLAKPKFGSNVIPNEELYTIWYRPPEMLAERNRNSYPILAGDIWAIAITVLEFILGYAIFQGTTIHNMLVLIYKEYRKTNGMSQKQFEFGNQHGTIQGNINVYHYIPYEKPEIIRMLTRMLTLNPDQRPTGIQLMHEFNGSINPEFLTTLYPPIYSRRIYIPGVELMIKVGSQLSLYRATILIGIEIFTRYLDLLDLDLDKDPFILTRALMCLQIATKYSEHDFFNVNQIIKHNIEIEKDILNKIGFQIYNLNLGQVIERVYAKNINLNQVELNQFAEPITYWLIDF